jgi:DNA repair protein RecN (Recombination protein N)
MLNAEKLATEVGAAIAAMSESEALSSAEAALDRAAQLDDAMQSIAEQIQSAIIHIQEAHSSLEQYLGTLEFDPERLQMVADRLDLIGRLKRKYGATIEEVLAYGSKTRVALAELEANEETMTALLGSEQKQSALVLEFADKLSALRKKASKQFATAIASQLRELAMESASFEVSLAPKAPDSTGAEAIEFLFSANPGHPPQPLTKIASGGEMSRVMLALRCVLAGASPAPTLVFDEIDGGLGGQTATVVGAKLRELSKHSQVIVITHLPQIAGLADEHFDVEKRAQDGATHVSLSRLEGEARVAALARMLGGSAVAQVALDHARELLKS